MGKYKQWLHHQEVGRRLRDQIASLEQERERVQKMAPTHPTTLPELDNAIIASLLAYTRQGNSLNRGGDVRGSYGQSRKDADPESGRPASGRATSASSQAQPTSAASQDPAVVASLLARADQMPTDPLGQMRDLSRGQGQPAADPEQTTAPTPSQPAKGGTPKGADSVGGWWQRYRPDDKA